MRYVWSSSDANSVSFEEFTTYPPFRTPKSRSNAPVFRLIVPSTVPSLVCIHVATEPVSSVRSSRF